MIKLKKYQELVRSCACKDFSFLLVFFIEGRVVTKIMIFRDSHATDYMDFMK